MRLTQSMHFVWMAIVAMSCPFCADDGDEKTTETDTDTTRVDAGDTGTGPGEEEQKSIAMTYASLFPIGVAVEPAELTDLDDIVSHHFMRLTAENAMKPESVQPSKGNFQFGKADTIADYARDHDMRMTGHVLVWHKQAADWMFSGLEAGNADDIETLKSRMKTHIETIVARYHDVVDNWDVVNEAISDDLTEIYRTDSDWYRVFGSEEYIYWAFKYAKDAMEAVEPGSSVGQLYYNDYDCSVKSNKILMMLEWLEDEKGIKIDGVGMQGHWGLDFPTDFSIQRAIDKFAAAGYKIKVSELDVTIYHDYVNGPSDVEAEKEFTPEIEMLQAERYGQIFSLFRDNSDRITSVTIWGVTDDSSWLNGNPVEGRSDYPLLFNADHTCKSAVEAILEY